MRIILASSSASRRAMLNQAGVVFDAVAPTVDENPIQAAHQGQDFELALALAEGHALAEAIHFATDVAALKCTHFGGRAGIPTRAEFERWRATLPRQAQGS